MLSRLIQIYREIEIRRYRKGLLESDKLYSQSMDAKKGE